MFFYLTTYSVPNYYTEEHFEPISEPLPAICYPYRPDIEYAPNFGVTLLFSGAHDAEAPFTPIHI